MISESDFSGVLVVVVEDGQALGSWSEVEKTNGDYVFKKLDGKKMEIVWYLVVKKVKGPENTQKKKKKIWYHWRGLKLKKFYLQIENLRKILFGLNGNLTTMEVEKDQGKLLLKICRSSNTSLVVQQKAVWGCKDFNGLNCS